jgi:tetratricopeptide (TPR) repeat protein
MKKLILALLIATYIPTIAQQNSDLAFSKSYAFEYETQYSKAIAAVTDLHADTYEINLRLGWLYYLSKDHTKSEQFYKKAVSLEKSSIEARFGLVLPMAALGDWNNILATYLEITKLDGNNSIANYRIASIYFVRKDYVSSTAYTLKVLKLYPFDYDSNLLYGKILAASGKNTEAKKYLTKALEYNPQSEEAKTALKKL